MLKVDPDLERAMTVCQAIEKMFAWCCKLCDKKVESTVHRTLRKILTQELTLYFSMCLMFEITAC